MITIKADLYYDYSEGVWYFYIDVPGQRGVDGTRVNPGEAVDYIHQWGNDRGVKVSLDILVPLGRQQQ